MTETLDEAVREAKIAAGLNPDEKFPPAYFVHQLAPEWRGPFWERQLDRVAAELFRQPNKEQMMHHHYMSTDSEGQPTFTCTAPLDAECHIWADCLSTDGCESDDEDCKHAPVRHDHCILSEWFAHPADTIAMHRDEHGDTEVLPRPDMLHARIEIEWDECPIWSFSPVHANGSPE